MPVVYQITFLPEGRTERFAGSRGNHYKLGGVGRLDLHADPAWCRPCGAVTEVETLPTLAAIDAELADLATWAAASFVAAGVRPAALTAEERRYFSDWTRRVAMARRRRRWRESRISPPKCIRCGGIDIVLLPLSERVVHPAGTGGIRLDVVGLCSTSFNGWFFTPEGDRIPRNPQPVSGHAPRTPAGVDLERADREAIGRFLATADIHPPAPPRTPKSLSRRIGRWLGRNGR